MGSTPRRQRSRRGGRDEAYDVAPRCSPRIPMHVVESGVERYQRTVRPTCCSSRAGWRVSFRPCQPPEFSMNSTSPSIGCWPRAAWSPTPSRRTCSPPDRRARQRDRWRHDRKGGARPGRHHLVAGHETMALALAWTWYLLSQHLAAEAKLREELASVLGGRAPRHEDPATFPMRAW
jgi:hypothetical protein